jgi:hypothetical protein
MFAFSQNMLILKMKIEVINYDNSFYYLKSQLYTVMIKIEQAIN